MSIDLKKGSKIDLKKSTTLNETKENDLSKIAIGLGWDVRKQKSGFFGKSDSGSDYDLDACAILLENNKLHKDTDVVYYGRKKHDSGKIWSEGDNLTGQGSGDDETVIACLESLDKKYNKVVFFATIYQGKSRNQHFSLIENAYIRAINNKGQEIAKYSISGDASLANKCSFVFAEAVRDGDTWMFQTIGEAYDTDKLIEIANMYK
jgi:tellurium resistance protein TerD